MTGVTHSLLALARVAPQDSFFHEQAMLLARCACAVGVALAVARLLVRSTIASAGLGKHSKTLTRLVPVAGFLAIVIIGAASKHETMGRRVLTLRQTIEGWHRTHVPLAYVSGDSLFRGSRDDDAGLYLLAPLYARSGRPAEAVAGDTAAAAAAGILCAWTFFLLALSRVRAPRAIGVAALPAVLLTAFLWRHGDIYWVPGLVGALACELLFADIRGLGGRRFAWAWIGFALLGGVATLFRRPAESIALATIVLGFAVRRHEVASRRAVRVIALAVAILVPRTVVAVAMSRSSAALDRGAAVTTSASHPFWHSVYIGYGVIDNPWNIHFNDMDAIDYVHSVDPRVSNFSAEYEAVLRARVEDIARHAPGFFVRQLLAKAALVLLSLAGGIVLAPLVFRAWARRGHDRVYVAVWLTLLLLACAPALLVIPALPYLLAPISILLVGGALLVSDAGSSDDALPALPGTLTRDARRSQRATSAEGRLASRAAPIESS